MIVNNVIIGKDGWLFLHEGSNFSISQLTGKIEISNRDLTSWIKIIKFRQRILGGKKYRTLVCAEKSCVYPQLLPEEYIISPRRPVELISRQVEGLYYPCNELSQLPDYEKLYPKTDTHYTEIGASIVARQIAESFGVASLFPEINLEWKELKIYGDLGIKMDPMPLVATYHASNFPQFEITDNGLRNRGRITVYQHIEKNIGPSLLIFGDSFSGINLAKYLTLFFNPVYFFHSSPIDYSLIERINPDYILAEYSERFLLKAPNEGTSFVSVIVEKHLHGEYNDKMMTDFINSLDKFEHLYGSENINLIHKLTRAAQNGSQ